MTRLNLLLLALLLASAAWLVRTSYESRRLYIELERQEATANELALERERLQIERREEATPARTERIARERLGMRNAGPAATQVVPLRSSSSSGAEANSPTGVAR